MADQTTAGWKAFGKIIFEINYDLENISTKYHIQIAEVLKVIASEDSADLSEEYYTKIQSKAVTVFVEELIAANRFNIILYIFIFYFF